jgi:hypothetical protein
MMMLEIIRVLGNNFQFPEGIRIGTSDLTLCLIPAEAIYLQSRTSRHLRSRVKYRFYDELPQVFVLTLISRSLRFAVIFVLQVFVSRQIQDLVVSRLLRSFSGERDAKTKIDVFPAIWGAFA